MPIDASIYRNIEQPPSTLQTLGAIQQFQQRGMEIQAQQRQLAAQQQLDQAYAGALTKDENGNPKIDENALFSHIPGHLIPATMEQFAKTKKSVADLQEAQGKVSQLHADLMGNLASTVQASGNDVPTFMRALKLAQANGWVDGPTATQYSMKAIEGGPAAVQEIVNGVLAGSTERSKLQNARDIANIRAKKGLEQKSGVLNGQQVQGVFDPNTGKTNVAGQDVTNQFQPPTAVLTPEQRAQLDRQSAANAETARHNRADEGLSGARVALERERLKSGEDVNVGVQADVRTTATGRQYVDLSKYKGKDYSAAQKQAHAIGVYGANAGESDALQNIDTARQNIDAIAKSLGKLPTSSLSRIAVGPLNRLEAAAQMDPELAAWGTYRSAAIQAMRAMAGSKGLRINKGEIETAMANDIPEITDTQATARRKIASVKMMLDHQETGVMGTSGQSSAASADDNPFRRK